jgi:lipid-A-disaccharide synthase-like uncharacterized protein
MPGDACRYRRPSIANTLVPASGGNSTWLLAYAICRQDPVFIAGQAFGFIVYLRNL